MDNTNLCFTQSPLSMTNRDEKAVLTAKYAKDTKQLLCTCGLMLELLPFGHTC